MNSFHINRTVIGQIDIGVNITTSHAVSNYWTRIITTTTSQDESTGLKLLYSSMEHGPVHVEESTCPTVQFGGWDKISQLLHIVSLTQHSRRHRTTGRDGGRVWQVKRTNTDNIVVIILVTLTRTGGIGQ